MLNPYSKIPDQSCCESLKS